MQASAAMVTQLFTRSRSKFEVFLECLARAITSLQSRQKTIYA